METTMEQIGTTILRLLMTTDKFFCYFLSGIDRVVEYPDPTGKRKPRVPFAGVAKSDNLSYVLLFNSEGWDRLKALEAKYKLENFCADVIKHEGLHIAYGHPTHSHLYKYHDIANIAMDLEINQYLPDITSYNKD